MFENILLPYSVIRIDTLLCYSGLLCWAHLQMCHPTPLYRPILLVILRNVPPYSVISHSSVNWNSRVTRSYLTDVTAANLWWHLSNMNVIQRIKWYLFKVENFPGCVLLYNLKKYFFQLRRQARQRREYIYRKSIEDRDRTIQEKKEKIKRALDGNLYETYEINVFRRLNIHSLHTKLSWLLVQSD